MLQIITTTAHVGVQVSSPSPISLQSDASPIPKAKSISDFDSICEAHKWQNLPSQPPNNMYEVDLLPRFVRRHPRLAKGTKIREQPSVFFPSLLPGFRTVDTRLPRDLFDPETGLVGDITPCQRTELQKAKPKSQAELLVTIVCFTTIVYGSGSTRIPTCIEIVSLRDFYLNVMSSLALCRPRFIKCPRNKCATAVTFLRYLFSGAHAQCYES